MIASGSQNQLQSSLAPFGDLFKALMFLSNLNGSKRKGSSKVWKEKGSKWFHRLFSLSPSYLCFALLVCFALLFWASLGLCIAFFNLFLVDFFSFLVYFFFSNKNLKKKIEKLKNTKTVSVCVHWYLCTLDGHWNKVF